MATRRASALTVNGRSYAWPDRPLVVMCIDGCEPDYVRQAIGSGAMPYLASALPGGTERMRPVSFLLAPPPDSCA